MTQSFTSTTLYFPNLICFHSYILVKNLPPQRSPPRPPTITASTTPLRSTNPLLTYVVTFKRRLHNLFRHNMHLDLCPSSVPIIIFIPYRPSWPLTATVEFLKAVETTAGRLVTSTLCCATSTFLYGRHHRLLPLPSRAAIFLFLLVFIFTFCCYRHIPKP